MKFILDLNFSYLFLSKISACASRSRAPRAIGRTQCESPSQAHNAVLVCQNENYKINV